MKHLEMLKITKPCFLYYHSPLYALSELSKYVLNSYLNLDSPLKNCFPFVALFYSKTLQRVDSIGSLHFC